MKKLNESFYFPIFIICLFLSFVITGEKYGFYHSLPSYYLFEMPNDIYGGNALINFFKWNLGFVLYFLTLFIISVIFKVKIELFKFITKMIKKKSSPYQRFNVSIFKFFRFNFEYII